MLASSSVARGGDIPTFQVNGSQDVTTWSLSLANFPLIDIAFAPATLTVDNLVDAGNSGLIAGSTMTFAGGSLSVNYFSYAGQDLPFNITNLVTFTTTAGSFSYDSELVNMTTPSILPDPNVTNASTVIYTQGTIHGPGGSSPANFALFVDFNGSFGSAAWAMYSPSVIPLVVPEPSTFVLAGLGLGATLLVRRRSTRGSARV